tara:strand:+ start:1049 stop:1489 length:441 start_codon:yes stop_codon:yes gene_type:complete
MTYNIQLEQKVTYKLFLAGLSLSSYTTNAVYQLGTATGNLSLSVSSGVITLPAGRYMCEAYPYVDVATQSDVVKFTFQQYDGSSYNNVGLEGQIQVVNDSMGDKDASVCVVDTDTSADIRLIVSSLSSTGTPTDDGGFIKIWKEQT